MTEVVIDGVRYVPAVTVDASVEQVLRTLALQYHTPETLAEFGFDDLRIIVADPGAFGEEGESFQEFAARMANQA
jgi:hypothetical protein